MNGRNGPMSPVSIGDSEWSGLSKYQAADNSEAPYSSMANNRGQLVSPPISSDSNGMMSGGGFPPRGADMPGGPSPPSSVGRSSAGAGLYAQSEGGRNRKDESFEGVLSEHYVALKRYLAASLRDEKGNPRPTRARDKLLRLSPVQFQELSTDVFDELLRRQQAGRRTPNGGQQDGGPPPYLLPKDTFHPKRNQARQKLSTLPPPRFRDLATDVYYELERRFPRFADDLGRGDSPAMSMRGPSRAGNGTPLGGPRMRRPSEASSAAGYSTRSESRNGPRPGGPMMNSGFGVPPSPGLPPNDFGRPTPKTFQQNTLVPNKSTMVEEDDTGGEDNEDDDGDAFGLEDAARNRESKKSSGGQSEVLISRASIELQLTKQTDKKLIDDYQSQVAELRERLDAMEDTLKQKDDEVRSLADKQSKELSVGNVQKKEWDDVRRDLEKKVSDADQLNNTLQSEMDDIRILQASTERELRNQIEELRSVPANSDNATSDLERENQELQAELREQQQVTEDVRREAEEFLNEMRVLSERSAASYEREEQLSDRVNKLEDEVKEWKNRYAKTKTQLRSLRASSIGLTLQHNAAKSAKESGFTRNDGLVKDVHVTKFQISIDELLQTARSTEPARVIEFMKTVVVNVRSITQDIDGAPEQNSDLTQQRAKLKSRVSATANNLITACRNFASAKGLSPISLVDAAASHLTSAVVELIRTVKIKPTPADELEDDEIVEPLEGTGFYPIQSPMSEINDPPPPFLGLRNGHASTGSSMYSPLNSPRDSTNGQNSNWRRPMSKPSAPNGLRVVDNKSLPPTPMGMGFGIRTQDSDVEELKIYLEDQTAVLVQNIQMLVSSIRSESGITAIENQIAAIAEVVGEVVSATEEAMNSSGNAGLKNQGQPILSKLSGCRERLLLAGEEGRAIADEGREDDEADAEWRAWNQSLPPIAFEIARETKELVLRVDVIDAGEQGDDDFS